MVEQQLLDKKVVVVMEDLVPLVQLLDQQILEAVEAVAMVLTTQMVQQVVQEL